MSWRSVSLDDSVEGDCLKSLSFVTTQLESSGQRLLALESRRNSLLKPVKEEEVAIQGGFAV